MEWGWLGAGFLARAALTTATWPTTDGRPMDEDDADERDPDESMEVDEAEAEAEAKEVQQHSEQLALALPAGGEAQPKAKQKRRRKRPQLENLSHLGDMAPQELQRKRNSEGGAAKQPQHRASTRKAPALKSRKI